MMGNRERVSYDSNSHLTHNNTILEEQASKQHIHHPGSQPLTPIQGGSSRPPRALISVILTWNMEQPYKLKVCTLPRKLNHISGTGTTIQTQSVLEA